MGWDGGTHIMDAVTRDVDRLVTEVWQLASGSEGARTPAFANELNADPALRGRVDNLIRPLVRNLASLLEDRGWDSQEEADEFTRFAQDMLGWDDEPFEGFLRHKLTEVSRDGTPDEIMAAAQRLKDHVNKMEAGKA
jgi:hypothetical protein